MFRATNSPILRSTFWLYIQLFVQSTDTAAHRCHCWDGPPSLNRGTSGQQCLCIVSKAVYTVKKYSWGWANLSPETCRAELKILINEQVVASCWLNITHVLSFLETFLPKIIFNLCIWKLRETRNKSNLVKQAGTAVAQCCATNRNGVSGIFHWHNPSDRTMALGSTQPLTEMSTRRTSWG